MSTPYRVLRWSFARASDHWQCELAFNAQHGLYELRVWDAAHPRVRVEYFAHVAQAILQQSTFEQRLIHEGYSLQTFQAGDPDPVATRLPVHTPRVLVVNSSEDTCDMLLEFFKLRGLEAGTLLSRRLRDGAVTAESLVADYEPDVVVFDVALPYTENWTALQSLRANPHVLCPFVVTTTNEAVLRQLTGTQEIVVEIVGKPYDLQRLYDVIVGVLNGSAPMARPATSDRRKVERRTGERRSVSSALGSGRTDDVAHAWRRSEIASRAAVARR